MSNPICHCIYIQIFFSSYLKLKALQSCSRLVKQGPILSTIQGLQFHPWDLAAPLELCFCASWHQQKHPPELLPCIRFQTALSIIRLLAKRHLWAYPQCTGRKSLDRAGGERNIFYLILQDQSQCYLDLKLARQQPYHSSEATTRSGTSQVSVVCHKVLQADASRLFRMKQTGNWSDTVSLCYRRMVVIHPSGLEVHPELWLLRSKSRWGFLTGEKAP